MNKPLKSKYYDKAMGGKILELIETFEIPYEYHDALREALSIAEKQISKEGI